MGKRIRIVSLPKAGSGLDVKMQGLKAGLGLNSKTTPWSTMAGKFSEPDVEINRTLKPVDRADANLEAEKDEVAMLPGAGGIPDTFVIGGKRHSEGGTPLKLPEESFIYSDTKDMRIKDPSILKQFGMTGKSYTPAEIAKKYDIGKFKKTLVNPDSDDLQKSTAEAMIKNYNLKLAKLALYQESMKGFPQGLPVVAMPYIMKNEIDTSEFMSGPGQPTQVDNSSQMQFGGMNMHDSAINNFPDEFFQKGGFPNLPGHTDYFNNHPYVNIPETLNYTLPSVTTYPEMPLGPDDVQQQHTGLWAGFKRAEKFPGQVVEGLVHGANTKYSPNKSFVNPETGNTVTQQGEIKPFHPDVPVLGALTEMALQPSSYLPITKIAKYGPEAMKLLKPFGKSVWKYLAKFPHHLKDVPGFLGAVAKNPQAWYMVMKAATQDGGEDNAATKPPITYDSPLYNNQDTTKVTPTSITKVDTTNKVTPTVVVDEDF